MLEHVRKTQQQSLHGLNALLRHHIYMSGQSQTCQSQTSKVLYVFENVTLLASVRTRMQILFWGYGGVFSRCLSVHAD